MADWVEITQAAGPSAVALAAIALAGRRQVRGIELERARDDRAELRKLLDDAVQSLRETQGLAGALHAAVFDHGANLAEAAPETYSNFQVPARQVEINHERLAIRLGPESRLVTAHERAKASQTEIAKLAASLRGASPTDAASVWRVMRDRISDLKAARAEVVHEAVALIGTSEPGRPLWRRLRSTRRQE